MESLPQEYRAVVVGAGGTIGTAVSNALEADPRCGVVVRVGRSSKPAIALEDEQSIAAAAEALGASPIHLLFDATGVLEIGESGPEKALKDLDPQILARAFQINAIGPALLIKHFAPLLPREGKSVFATLSARVGSIGDNRLGGWYAYRASKAALNQLVRTAAIEIARKRPEALCVALHPGTVESGLSRPYANGRFTFSAVECADRLLGVLDRLTADRSGGFFAYDGSAIPW